MRLLLYSLTLLLSAVVGDESPSTPASADAMSSPSSVVVEPARCVDIAASKCPDAEDRNKTRCLAVDDDAVICCHIKTAFELKEGFADAYQKSILPVTKLHVRNATFRNATPTHLSDSVLNITEFTTLFRNLTELSITDGNITRIIGEFTPNFTCLNLSNNGLQSIEHSALGSVHMLQQLGIANNNLSQLPMLNSMLPDIWLDISGLNQLPCTNITQESKSLEELNHTLHFNHINNTTCLLKTSYNWFNGTMRIPLLQVEAFNPLKEACPLQCICSFKGLIILPDSTSRTSVSVDCSNMNLTDLPPKLPENTVSLNVSNNNISSLAALVNESSYQNLREFYADNNQIPSIIILEGSKFISAFDVLTLRGNRIKIIPTYFLSNTFDEHSGITVKLGHNHVTCDCNAALTTKVWLMLNQKNVIDYEEVMCDNLPGRLIDLDKNNVCTEQRLWTDYLYYIIAAEVTLLILLVAKVTYDYMVFKTAGYLPWPASKMPKLPCDWVFET